MPNQYKNKVIYNGNTLIDLTDATATADKILSGYTAYGASGEKLTGTATGGGGSAITVVESQDTNGGTIKNIVAVDISNDTVTAADVAQGVTFHTADGTASVGTVVSEDIKEVTFYDYDGSIAYTYTTEEFLALSSMPTVPTHTGLTSDGWNWSYADARTWVNKYGILAIGNIVHPSDGSTRILVNPKAGESLTINRSGGTLSGTVDWGDETTTTISSNSVTHTYEANGHYDIRIHSTADVAYAMTIGGDTDMVEEVNLGQYATSQTAANLSYGRKCRIISFPHGLATVGINFTQGYTNLEAFILPNSVTTISNTNNQYQSVKAVSFPNNVYTSIPWFLKCPVITVRVTTITTPSNTPQHRLKYLVFSDDATAFSTNQRFQGLTGLRRLYLSQNVSSGEPTYYFTDLILLEKLVMPKLVTSIAANAFIELNRLEELTLPSNLVTVGNESFTNMYSLASLSIPSTVTSIGNKSFSQLNSLRELHFYSTTPPTVGGTDAFSGLNSTCIIYVPYSADHSVLEAYQAATNLSRFASQMVEEVEE